MKILGLPGINPLTEQWMKKLFSSIELDQADVAIQQYQCWTNPGAKLNLEREAKIVAKSKPDIVIAKSIGTRVALFTFTKGLTSSNACIFIGTPVRGYSNDELSELIKLCAFLPMLFIQQTDDPTGSYSLLASSIPDSTLCKMCEVPGSDHFYGNIDQLKEIIESWYRGIGSLRR